jgi:hypothetical protein
MRSLLALFLLAITAKAQSQCLSGDCANGEGSCVINKETIYTGSFKNNLPDGKGSFANSDYIIYTGEVKHGLYNGKGTLYYENGDVYVGVFKNGLRHGPGEYRSKKGVVSGNFFYNGLDGRNIVSDQENQNGIYTAYEKVEQVSLSNNKVGIFGVTGNLSKCFIFDATTGQKLESVGLTSLYDPERTNLYLDFGTEFYDTVNKHWRMNTKSARWLEWHYWGKSVNGDAIFSERDADKDEARIFTMADHNARSKTVYTIRVRSGAYIKAVSPDFSRIVVDNFIIDLADKKKAPVPLVDYKEFYNDRMIFSSSRDSLLFTTMNITKIYSVATGREIGTVPKIDLKIPTIDYSLSFDPNYIIRIVQQGNGCLVLVEGAFDKSQVTPMINNEYSYIGAEVYWDKAWKEAEANRQFAEREHQEYVRKMEARYGPDWDKDKGTAKGLSNTPPTPSYTKCTFCHGSGVTANYVTGQEITQDKNGRWYHANLAKTGTCPMCNGTGFIKR